MGIDASIALGVKPAQFENPVNRMAQILQIKGAQQEQALNGLKADEYRQGVERSNRMRDILGAGGGAEELRKGGFLKESVDLEKANRDNQKAQAEAEYKQIETAHKRVDLMGQSLGWLRQNPSVENAQMVARHWVTNGVAPPEKVKEMLAQVQANPTPQAIAQFATMGYQAALSAKDQLPKFETRNTGGTTDTISIDPVTGKVGVANQVRNTQSPDNLATNARIAADNAASRGQAERHFQIGQNTPQYMETEAGLVALPKKLAPGQAPSATVVLGQDGQPLGKPLKQIPGAANTAIIANAQNLSKAQQALALLEGNNVGAMQGDPNATGVRGMLPGAILNRIDPKGVDTRAAIADLGSMVLHDRSGAAVTASEYPRLQPFIPTATDDAATAAKKLRRFIQVYQQEQGALQQAYGKDQGYRPSPVQASGVPSVPAGFRVLGVEK